MDHRRLHAAVQLLCLQDARVHDKVKQDKGDKDDGKSNQKVREKDTDKENLEGNLCVRFSNYIWWRLPAKHSSECIVLLFLRGKESLCPLQLVIVEFLKIYIELTFVHIL